jgi:hypothetical protein
MHLLATAFLYLLTLEPSTANNRHGAQILLFLNQAYSKLIGSSVRYTT